MKYNSHISDWNYEKQSFDASIQMMEEKHRKYQHLKDSIKNSHLGSYGHGSNVDSKWPDDCALMSP